MALRAVIYDLDGTLVDSRRDLADAVNALLALRGHAPLPVEQVVGFVGEGAELLLRRALAAARRRDRLGEEEPDRLDPELVRGATADWPACYGPRVLVHTRLYPGIEAALSEPPDLRGVLTNKPRGYSLAILDGLGIGARFAVVRGGDQGPRKPDPSGLVAVCRELGVAPEEALLVGDTQFDRRAARAAGVPFCAAMWGLSPREELLAEPVDHLCESAAELPALLRRLR
jgi:phosphoglycolate phosphatase